MTAPDSTTPRPDLTLERIEKQTRALRRIINVARNGRYPFVSLTTDVADVIADTLDALAKQALSQPVAQDGWQLVPIEPSREMWAAGGNVVVGYKNRHHDKVVADLWEAMLAVAPPPPADVPHAGEGE